MSLDCVLPSSLYHDALEEHLLLDAFRDLYHEQLGTCAPAALSLAQHNDLLEYARSVLDGRCQPSASYVTPPATLVSSVEPCSRADRFCTHGSERWSMLHMECGFLG